MLKPTKATKKIVQVSDAPAVYMYSEDGVQAGILNLHSSIRQFWGQIKAESLEANQADLFVHAHDKGHTLCRRSTTGKLVQLGWINGNDAGKEAFLSKFGTEKIRFSMPTTVEDMGDLI